LTVISQKKQFLCRLERPGNKLKSSWEDCNMDSNWIENDKTEFKSILNDKLEKEVVAFLNSKTAN
jgi:hypothetical protein